MQLSPEHVITAGYTPVEPDLRSRTPQMRALSTNACPNMSATWLTDPPGHCPPHGLTSWGYCGPCWEANAVPAVWAARVLAALGDPR
jgi:hypothetical protein